MSEHVLEKELEGLYHELGENGGSPELLVRARTISQKCHTLCDRAAQLIHDVAQHSPARLSLQAVKQFHGTEVVPQVTSNIVTDLKRTIDRIDSAEVSLLVGLGEMAQRIMMGEQVWQEHETLLIQLYPGTFYQLAVGAHGAYRGTQLTLEAYDIPAHMSGDLLKSVQKTWPDACLVRCTTRVSLEPPSSV